MADWVAAYPIKPEAEPFLADIAPLMRALVQVKLPAPDNRSLAQLALTSKDCQRAVDLAAGWTAAATGVAPPPPVQNPNMRVTAAAIRLAYESKPDIEFQTVAAAALTRAVRKGFRDSGPPIATFNAARANRLLALLTDTPL